MSKNLRDSLKVAAAILALFGGLLLLDREHAWTDWVAGIALGGFALFFGILYIKQPKRKG